MFLRNLFWCFLLLFLTINCIANSGQSPVITSGQRIKDFYLCNWKDNGLKDWEMEGEEAIVFDEYVEVEKMKARYFSKDMIIDIKADRGKLYKPQMDVSLNDNVQIKSNTGYTLFTDSLTWRKNNNLIETQDKVRLEKDSIQVEAKGLEAKTDLKNAKFSEDVKVDFVDQKSADTITITCDGPLEIDYPQGTAIFNNNVIVESEQGKLFSDKATLYFNREQKSIVKAVSIGNVKIIRDNNVAFAQKATYLHLDKKIILEGRPRLIIIPQKESQKDEDPRD
jgi:LPS export ABC transporter protein LptC